VLNVSVMLDLVKLAALRAVVEHGSFSAAARALHLTQPGVSRQIAALERRLATPVVRRSRHGVQLTEAGRVLLGHAEAAMARLELAEAEIAALRGLHRGTVRLGSFFSALVHLSAEVGAALDTAHPGVVVVDALVDREAALEKLRRGALDLAIVFEHDFEPAAPAEDLVVHPLFDDPLRVVLPQHHRLAAHDRVAVADLAADTWIRPHDGSAARRVDLVLARAGIAPPLLHAGHGDEPFEAQALVAAGRGVALTHNLTVVVGRHQVAIRPLAGVTGLRRVQVALTPGPQAPAVVAALHALHAVGRAHRLRLGRDAGESQRHVEPTRRPGDEFDQ
jgi:DNA-binding transcriptional LysR family regulator